MTLEFLILILEGLWLQEETINQDIMRSNPSMWY